MLQRLYHALAILAIAHLVAIAGIAVHLVVSGRLDAQKAEMVAQILRGEPLAAATQPAASQPAPETEAAQQAIVLPQTEQDRQLLQALLERERAEIRYREELAEREKLALMREREELEKLRARIEAERRAREATSQAEGFTKELEVLSSVKAKQRKLLLMQKEDAEVVRLLKAMDPRLAKQVIEACKTPEEMAWISRILAQFEGSASSQPAAEASAADTASP